MRATIQQGMDRFTAVYKTYRYMDRSTEEEGKAYARAKKSEARVPMAREVKRT